MISSSIKAFVLGRPVVGRRREPSNFLATSLRCQERIVLGTNDLGDFIESSSCEPFANLGQAHLV